MVTLGGASLITGYGVRADGGSSGAAAGTHADVANSNKTDMTISLPFNFQPQSSSGRAC